MENRCLICGTIIPEGREVCPNCEAGEIPEQTGDGIVMTKDDKGVIANNGY